MVIWSKKQKNLFLDKVDGSMCAKFQVCIIVSVARRRDTNKYINKYIHIQRNLRVSSTGCSPYVDFDNTLLTLVEKNLAVLKFFKNTEMANVPMKSRTDRKNTLG